MTIDAQKHREPKAPPNIAWRRPGRWAFLALMCTAIAAAQVWLEAKYDSARRAHQARWNQVSAADRAAAEHAWRVYRSFGAGTGGRPEPTLDDAARQLNGGRPFDEVVTDGRSRPRYVDPATGGQAILDRQGDTWTGADSAFFAGRYTEDPRIGPGPNPNRGAHGVVTGIRRIGYILMYAAWALLLVVTLAHRDVPHAVRVGRAVSLLELATVATFLAFFGPRYWHAWDEFTQDDSAGPGLIAIAVSVTLLAALRRSAKRRDGDATPRCGACRYDLTGNESGVCPECGTTVAETQPA